MWYVVVALPLLARRKSGGDADSKENNIVLKSKMIWTSERLPRLEHDWFIHLKELARFWSESIGGFSATYIDRSIALLSP